MEVLIQLVTAHPLVAAVVIVSAGYAGSVVLHPYVKCTHCDGGAKHYGAVWRSAWRPCHHCGGVGRRRRLGARILGRGQPVRSTSRVQPPADS